MIAVFPLLALLRAHAEYVLPGAVRGGGVNARTSRRDRAAAAAPARTCTRHLGSAAYAFLVRLSEAVGEDLDYGDLILALCELGQLVKIIRAGDEYTCAQFGRDNECTSFDGHQLWSAQCILVVGVVIAVVLLLPLLGSCSIQRGLIGENCFVPEPECPLYAEHAKRCGWTVHDDGESAATNIYACTTAYPCMHHVVEQLSKAGSGLLQSSPRVRWGACAWSTASRARLGRR